jgi:ribonuclease I
MNKILIMLGLTITLLFSKGEKGEFDYYVFALSWEAGFCEKQNYSKIECKEAQKDEFSVNNFILHGLWPNKNDDPFSKYSDCENTYKCEGEGGCWPNLPDLHLTAVYKEKLSKYMPGVDSYLQRHEWHKHGTCTNKTPTEYFNQASKLVEEFSKSSFDDFISDHRGSRVTNGQIYQEFEKAFGKSSARTLKLLCSKKANGKYLTEIRFSLKKDIDVTKSISSNIFTPEGNQFDGCGGENSYVNILELKTK